MPDQKIVIIGNDDIVLLFGLLGIDGIILDDVSKFKERFEDLIKKPLIGMIIIALKLSEDIVTFLEEFKLNNRRPFIFLLPDIFQTNIENDDVFLNKIKDSLGKIII